MKIILGGGGNEIDSFESHKIFYESLKDAKRILYIPVAILGEKHSAKDCLQWFHNAFKSFDLKNVEMITSLEDPLTDKLDEFDGIYFGGGNTFKLLHEIHNSGFDSKVRDYLEHDGIVYGGSAGAIIFGKSIETARIGDTNNYPDEDSHGLDLLNNYSVWCHYQKGDYPHIRQLITEGLKIIAIGESSAVIKTNDTFNSIGKEVEFFE